MTFWGFFIPAWRLVFCKTTWFYLFGYTWKQLDKADIVAHKLLHEMKLQCSLGPWPTSSSWRHHQLCLQINIWKCLLNNVVELGLAFADFLYFCHLDVVIELMFANPPTKLLKSTVSSCPLGEGDHVRGRCHCSWRLGGVDGAVVVRFGCQVAHVRWSGEKSSQILQTVLE